jgi:hypothetical protein
MKKGYLSEYFEGVAVKRLTRVDATAKSNQHEVGTTAPMRRFLGDQRCEFPAVFLWLGGEQASFSEHGSLTLYDVRELQPHRSAEWRLYYRSNAVTESMNEGDTLFLAKRTDNSLLFIITPPESTIQDQLLWLFGFEAQPSLGFEVNEFSGDADAELDFAARLVLDELGVEYEDPNANSLDAIIERYGTSFPKTREFSDLARLTLPEVNALDDPDQALVAWLDHEEALFRRLERKVVSERIAEGFLVDDEVDVDGFIYYSLQVQNRRKSRMGRSFEHQLEAVFRAFELEFEIQAVTEHGNTADFLFPGSTAYGEETYPAAHLTMLAAKSSCKDRWRQVLPEARRIWPKHLITIEPSISIAQTEQMDIERLQLVVPTAIHETYKSRQRAWLMNLAGFIEMVRHRECRA